VWWGVYVSSDDVRIKELMEELATMLETSVQSTQHT
jgi:hypothetical protein